MGIHWREVLLMSRSIKGSKACGYDYWSRRPYSGHGHGRKIKDICHGMERAQERELLAKEKSHALDNHFGFFCDFFPQDEFC